MEGCSWLEHLSRTLGATPSHYVADSIVWDQVSRSYYGADGTLRFFARRGTESHRESAPRQDEYWYDALGRRVLVRSMADTTNGTYAESLAPSTITRSVWDGNTLLAEFQGIGTFTQSYGTLEIDGTGSSPVSNQQPYGSIIYVEGGLDAPLAFRRTVSPSDHVIVPHTNYRGLYDDGTTSSGAAADADIAWPGNNRRTYGELITTMTGVGWAGSLVPDYQGESGLQYKRNRYYDPATGKFTQLDPIGLGGGSNLYGYANGDPINNKDPFGLDTVEVGCRPVEGTDAFTHCAVRVQQQQGDTTKTSVYELLGANGVGGQQFAGLETDREQLAKFAGWAGVAAPQGETTEQFAAKVVQQAARFSFFENGKPYIPLGGWNSDRFVYNVITSAGGRVPQSALIPGRTAPGVCGGRGIMQGFDCKM